MVIAVSWQETLTWSIFFFFFFRGHYMLSAFRKVSNVFLSPLPPPSPLCGALSWHFEVIFLLAE